MTDKTRLISEIQPINATSGRLVKTRADIAKIVEAPLVEACQILYDKNIETTCSSANQKNIYDGNGNMTVVYGSLSNENKRIGEGVGRVNLSLKGTSLYIPIPISETSTVEGIRSYSTSIANKFQKQPMTWVRKNTLEDLRRMVGRPGDENLGPEIFSQDYFYDETSGLFYVSKEHFEKANEVIDQNE